MAVCEPQRFRGLTDGLAEPLYEGAPQQAHIVAHKQHSFSRGSLSSELKAFYMIKSALPRLSGIISLAQRPQMMDFNHIIQCFVPQLDQSPGTDWGPDLSQVDLQKRPSWGVACQLGTKTSFLSPVSYARKDNATVMFLPNKHHPKCNRTMTRLCPEETAEPQDGFMFLCLCHEHQDIIYIEFSYYP